MPTTQIHFPVKVEATPVSQPPVDEVFFPVEVAPAEEPKIEEPVQVNPTVKKRSAFVLRKGSTITH